MASSSRPSYLAAASTLIKALKGTSDPPQADWPSKIIIAEAAWNCKELHVPRKAVVLREWILESWSKISTGSKKNTLLDEGYHKLLVSISSSDPDKSTTRLPTTSPNLLTVFFKSLSSTLSSDSRISPELLQQAASSFEGIYPSTITQKAEAWIEVWVQLIEFLALNREETKTVVKVVNSDGLERLVRLVCEGLTASLSNSQNRKKIASTLLSSLPSYARGIANHPSLRQDLEQLSGLLLLPLPTLQGPNPFLPVVTALIPRPAEVSSETLAFLPHLLEAFIKSTYQHRYPLFTQPSSSKLPLDVYLAGKVRNAIKIGLEQTLQVVNDVEDAYVKSGGKTIPLPSIWRARREIWSVVSSWGGYMETESAWGDLVDREARRAENVLLNNGGTDDLGGKDMAGLVLQTLVLLEELDHARTAVGTDVVGWCLASPARAHPDARAVLLSLLRYHRLTHSLGLFVNHLTTSIESLFPASRSLPFNVVTPLHDLVTTGPITEKGFAREFQAALRSLNIGGRRSSAWANIVLDLVNSMGLDQNDQNKTNDDDSSAPTKKRKRDSGAIGVTSAVVSIQSRILKLSIDSARYAQAGDKQVEDCFESVSSLLQNLDAYGQEAMDSILGSKKSKKDIGNKSIMVATDWSGDLILAAKLRISRSLDLVIRKQQMDSLDGVLIKLNSSETLPEARLEIVEYLLQLYALRPLSAGNGISYQTFVDDVLSIMESASEAWNQRATVLPSQLGSAVWEIIADRGMAILDGIATVSQLGRLSKILIQQLSKASDVTERILASSEIWELPNLRTAMLSILTDPAYRASGTSFGFLNSSPTSFLTRQARSILLESAYTADKSLEDDTGVSRAMIRTWLARLAKQDGVLGPLVSDVKTVKRLSKMSKDVESSSEVTEATLELLQSAFLHICKSPEQHAELLDALVQDAINSRPFSKWSKKLRKDQAASLPQDLRAQSILQLCTAFTAGNFESITANLRTQLSRLCDVMLEDLEPVVKLSLSSEAAHKSQMVFKAWRVVLRFRKQFGGTAQAASFGNQLFSAVVRAIRSAPSTTELETLGATTLDIMALEAPSKPDPEAFLAVFIVLSSLIPCAAIDLAFTSFIKMSGLETFSVLIDATAQILRTSGQGQTRAALHTMSLLAGTPIEGSGKSVGRALLPVLLSIDTNIEQWSSSLVYESVRLLDTASSERAGVLNQPTVSIIWSIILQVLLPSRISTARPRHSNNSVFTLVMSTISSIIRHRTDVVISTLPQVVAIFCTVFGIFQRSRINSASSKLARKRIASRWPSWLLEEDEGLGETEAIQFSRLLTTLSTGKTSTSRLNRSSEIAARKNTPLSGPLAKQAPAILVAYVRSVADPLGGLSTEIRKQLEPGLWSLCEILTVGGRVDGRGREGEGLGIPFGLGDGPGGEAEKEVWAEMWMTWSRRRYVGQG